jgi:ATP-binding cassette subfamily B (MDR/TAP) protein 1
MFLQFPEVVTTDIYSIQWKLSLVVYTIIPATIISVTATAVGDLTLEIHMRRNLEFAASLARDCLLNIRDILSSRAETQVKHQYDELLHKAMQYGFRKAPLIGLQYCCELFFISVGYTLSFWYGTKLYSEGEASMSSILMFVLVEIFLMHH